MVVCPAGTSIEHFQLFKCPNVSPELRIKNNLSVKFLLLLSVLAGDQWWPRTSGGRLRFAYAVTQICDTDLACL